MIGNGERVVAAAPRRIVVVDGLRLMAALMVAAYHFVGYDPGVKDAWGLRPAQAFPGTYHIASYGWLGVELFFMISGFVICLSCWGRTPGDFFRSRVTRLFPAYWPAVLITTAVVTLWPTVRHRLGLNDVVVNLTMLNDPLKVPAVDGSYWTLWSEARFYLLFAVVVWLGLTRRSAVIFCYAWLVAHVITVSTDQPILMRALFQPEFAPFFIAGIGFYLISRFGPDVKLWGIVGLSYAIAQHNTFDRVTSVGPNNLDRPLNPIIGVLLITGYFLVMAAVALGWLSRIQWRWLTAAGALTYPFYLLHETIGWTLIHALRDAAPRYVVLAVVMLVMLAAAWLLHRLIEKPLARYLKVKLAAAKTRIDDLPAPRIPRPRAEPEPAPAGAVAER